MTAIKNTVHLALDIELFKKALTALSLEQMQDISVFLGLEIQQKIEAKDVLESKPDRKYQPPAITIDMIEKWEEEKWEEEEEEMTDEEFYKAVQEMS